MKIYVARHGQTQWNAENRVCGRTDLPLTEKGVEQARELAQKAQTLELDMIISSPMLRARTMSGIVSDICGIPAVVDKRLIEQDYGIFEGVDRKDPGFLNNKRQFAYRYPGGESMMQVAHRVYSLLEDVRREYAGKNVLLVCHGGVCRVIHTYFEDMTNEEYFEYSVDNASVKEYVL